MTRAGGKLDDGLLDRLVDGELNSAEYRELLRSLDRRPAGWRQCALAFLEAQAWRRELGGMRDAEAGSRPAGMVSVRSPSRVRSWTTVLAVAASLLLAFALGVGFRAQWPVLSPTPDGGQLATGDKAKPTPNQLVERAAPPPRAREGDSSLAAPSGNLRLVVGDPDGRSDRQIDVPLYEWAPGRLPPRAASVPPEVQRALQRMGRQLRWERQFVPLNLEGGRRVLLPVEQLEITPVEHGLYQ